MSDKKQNMFFGCASVLALILAVFGFICSANSAAATIARVLFGICSVLLLVLAVIYATVVVISRDTEPNFFLCDLPTGKNIAEDKLDVARVAERVDYYIDLLGGVDRLIRGRVLIDGNFGVGAVLRPAVVYRLLQRAAVDDAVFALVEHADDRIFETICRELEKAGETDMPAAIMRHRQNKGSSDSFKRFLVGNQRYIQSRSLVYVRRNLELFY
ncbi:MAG: hypothetical protein IJY27_04190 [Clostridia bacterium]|nr:hypothetical protein [Clostridia bacterium]